MCGGHHSWKETINKILRVGFYWPSIFLVYIKKLHPVMNSEIFDRKIKLLPFPLNLISMEEPFQQWGLYFIGEINPNSSGQHKWICNTTNYFTKWIEAIPTKRATDIVIVEFIDNNILSRFRFPNRVAIDNSQSFKSKKLISFCHRYHINLNHSTAYYPQGNGLVKYSN